MFGIAFAQTSTAQASSASPLSGFLPIIIIFFIFYILIIRPQQKKAKEHQNMLKALNKGDQVITSGGIHGVITAIKGNIVELKVAENCKIEVSKGFITALRKQGETGEIPEG